MADESPGLVKTTSSLMILLRQEAAEKNVQKPPPLVLEMVRECTGTDRS